MQVIRTKAAAPQCVLGALTRWGLETPPHPAGCDRTPPGACPARARRGLARLIREGSAQDLAEYGMSLAVIGAGAAAAALAISGVVTEMWIEHARLLQKIASLAGS